MNQHRHCHAPYQNGMTPYRRDPEIRQRIAHHAEHYRLGVATIRTLWNFAADHNGHDRISRATCYRDRNRVHGLMALTSLGLPAKEILRRW